MRETIIKKIPITKPRLFNFLYIIHFGLKENDIKENGNGN
jgi:hypothetical protein